MSELESLRHEISELDRRLLELLNRRLELVASVRDYKEAAGERWIDPEREAELLQALVAANPEPSRDEIRHAMAGNICRCGTYPKIEEAIRTWRD